VTLLDTCPFDTEGSIFDTIRRMQFPIGDPLYVFNIYGQLPADSHGSLSTAADLRLTTYCRPRRQLRRSRHHLQPGGIANVNHGDTMDQHAQTSSQRTFHCFLFNSRSLLNKLPELYNMLYNDNAIDCICVTESWLHDEIPDSLLDPKSMYTVMRCDRVGLRGGGVCLFVKKIFRC